MRGVHVLLAGDRRVTGDFLNITEAAWTLVFQWWRAGDIMRTQNVSKYMLILALCLVPLADKRHQHMPIQWLGNLVVNALDGRLHRCEFHSQPPRLILGWVS